MLEVGDKVRIDTNSMKTAYEAYKGQILEVTGIVTSEEEYEGYDEYMEGMPLCSLRTLCGTDLTFWMYEYELEKV